MGYSGAQGTLIYEKNLMSKISCQTPFKYIITFIALEVELFYKSRFNFIIKNIFYVHSTYIPGSVYVENNLTTIFKRLTLEGRLESLACKCVV